MLLQLGHSNSTETAAAATMPSLPRISLFTPSELSPSPIVSILLGVTAGAAVCSLYWLLRRDRARKTNVYETSSQLNQYLWLHFATKEDMDFPEFLPENGLEFPLRCAQVCVDFCSNKVRALDLGCAVGRSSFELAKEFSEVLAVDYSQSFVDAGNQLVRDGQMQYKILEEGVCGREATATVDSAIDRRRLRFMRADASSLPTDIGTFDCILAANLICRLKNPLAFLTKVSSLLKANGILVLTTPFTWSSEYTERSLWLGGKESARGSSDSFTELKKVLDRDFELSQTLEMPFLLKETRRKHQWTIALCSVWRVK